MGWSVPSGHPCCFRSPRHDVTPVSSSNTRGNSAAAWRASKANCAVKTPGISLRLHFNTALKVPPPIAHDRWPRFQDQGLQSPCCIPGSWPWRHMLLTLETRQVSVVWNLKPFWGTWLQFLLCCLFLETLGFINWLRKIQRNPILVAGAQSPAHNDGAWAAGGGWQRSYMTPA